MAITNQPAHYPFARFEEEWQRRWLEARIFQYEPGDIQDKPKWYVMDLPPFANGKLHMGHVRNYVMSDVSARFRRMCGYKVLYTSGFDSFGLPNELAAIEAGVHPAELASQVIAAMRADFQRLGLSHDTRRLIGYHEADYYQWVQWVFLRLFEHGMAYRKESRQPWCPQCMCTLADSLCEDGKCWRCKHPVEARTLPQWFIREDIFADQLLEGLNHLPGWPSTVKKIHADWIGRREGVEADFELSGAKSTASLTVFLHDAGLLSSVAAIVISPDHELLDQWTTEGLLSEAAAACIGSSRRALSCVEPSHPMESVHTGLTACHPLLHDPVPIIVANAIDTRHQNGLMAICPSRIPADRNIAEALGLSVGPSEAASNPVIDLVEGLGLRRVIRYRLRDWNIARQRYWGPPVPIVHCPACGAVAVPDEALPVRIPDSCDLSKPNPLQSDEGFRSTNCPKCGGPADRDTDTLEAYSSPWWYHWNCKGTTTTTPFCPAEYRACLPVDLMIGGDDQIRGCFFHVRMIARALKRMNVADIEEPVLRVLPVGMVKSQGKKMSKSEGNAVDPFQYVESFGADALRFAVMAVAAPENEVNWEEGLVSRAHSWLREVWDFFERHRTRIDLARLQEEGEPALDLTYSMAAKFARQLAAGVSRVTGSLESNRFHSMILNLTQCFERIEGFEQEAVKRRGKLDVHDEQTLVVAAGAFLRMLAPVCPHIAEELWWKCGGVGFAALADWPDYLRAQPKRGEHQDARGTAAAGGPGF